MDITHLKMPAVSPEGMEIMELISSDDYSMNQLAKLISNDPVLTSTLLKYANSPVYNPASEITSVSRAATILGAKALGAAVIVASMRGIAEQDDATEHLWNHSRAVATISRLITKRHYPRLADNVELAALIHDIGALVLASNFPEQYSQIVESALDPNNQLALSELEKKAFGVSHDEVTAEFMQYCRIPEVVRQIIDNFHQRPPLVDAFDTIRQQTAIVSLAHRLEEEINSHVPHLMETMPESTDTLMLCLGLTEDNIDNFLEDFDEINQVEA